MQVLSTVPVMFSYWVNVIPLLKIFYYALNRSGKHRSVKLHPKQRVLKAPVAPFYSDLTQYSK